ncbi:DUF4362 domain-containing protein [Jeotgalibacillus campisalis]|uniref:DUF4362 domain-containing protein n=1 Tax=Jeotgalibacillus campisalis TaxID=220754 RepID=A0A0C2RLM9_9BACL|nr:DUF4362 domain-containing protein [Jeotgalibacillus campisalis]KIL51155.1 hypothetical protein KR50_10360 [Jeotgalibacillus campisalis]
MEICKVITIAFVVILSGCSSANENDRYGGADVDRKRDVIESHGMIENISLLNDFVEHVQAGEKDSLKIVQFTTEGDPIFYQLDYDENLNYAIDTTKDSYGSGEINEYQCDSIKKTETSIETSFTLEGCSGGSQEILTISHNTEQQDYFEVSLKTSQYELNTEQLEWIEKSEEGETVTSDFQLSTKDLNEIYKELVFANYLEEKALSSSCDPDGTDTYKLKVWINSGEREFEWAACENTVDSKAMTAAAQRIIEIGQAAAAFE